MRCLKCVFLLLIPISVCSQEIDFKKGLDSFRDKQYLWSDYYFSKIIKSDTSKADAYFNRALSRYHLSDRKGFCEDMACASNLKDEEALYFYKKFCVNSDTIYINGGCFITEKEEFANIISKPSMAMFNNAVIAEAHTCNLDTIWEPLVSRPDTYRAEYLHGNDSLKKQIVFLLSKSKDLAQKERVGDFYFWIYINEKGRVMFVKLIHGKDEGLEALMTDAIKNITSFKPGEILGLQHKTRMPLRLKFVLK